MAKISENIIERQEQTEDIEAQEFVKENFASLGIEVGKDRTLFTRLVELQKIGHFEDAVEMSKIIDFLPVKNRDRLKLCALLHDVGKTGPLDATPEEQQIFSIIFHHKNFQDCHQLASIKEVLDKELEAGMSTEKIKKIEKYLISSLGMDIEKRLMIDLWHDHTDYTYEILKNAKLPQIDETIVKIAVSHHIPDGRNPAQLPLDRLYANLQISEIIGQYQLLTLIDKYQAYRRRNGYSHPEAIKALKQTIKAKKEIPENIKDQYLELVEPFNQAREELDKIFKHHT